MGLCVLMSDNFIVFQTGEWRRMSLPAIKQRVQERERREEQRRERLLGYEFRVGKQVIDYKGNHNLIR
jgi:hypothetical protein